MLVHYFFWFLEFKLTFEFHLFDSFPKLSKPFYYLAYLSYPI
jgi:hypothetical protein